jgi:PAS domain-containing protein
MEGLRALVVEDAIEASARFRPNIILTAHSDKDTLHRAMRSDPCGYVLKPLNERELVVAIEMSLHRFDLESRLRESENRFAATLASIGDGVIATDLDGHITFMNAVAEKLTEWQRDLAHGRGAGEVMRIVDEASGEGREMPLSRALRKRDTVHLAEPTDRKSPGRGDRAAAPGPETGIHRAPGGEHRP